MADVEDSEALDRAATAIESRFGPIGVWVNYAARRSRRMLNAQATGRIRHPPAPGADRQPVSDSQAPQSASFPDAWRRVADALVVERLDLVCQRQQLLAETLARALALDEATQSIDRTGESGRASKMLR